MIINFSNIKKSFGTDIILNNVSGNINADSRIGIIGANGAGKTTLLNILSGNESNDEGSLYINPEVKIGYLTQNNLLTSTKTVYDEMRTVFSKEINAIKRLNELDLSIIEDQREYDKLISYISSTDAYNIDVKINYVLNGMGFTEAQKVQYVSSLSGGERTRLALAKVLLTDSNVLFLDEPTNHLDFTTAAWLESYLSEFKGAVICVTHDRYFLDKVCNKIWEIEFGKINEYNENYSGYKALKAKTLESRQKEYEAYIERKNKLEDYVARNIVRASTSAMAKSRQKELERMDEVERPIEYTKQINVTFKMANKSWFDVLKTTNLTVYMQNRKLFDNLDLDIKAGEKVAIIGDNGTGKTTLFNVLQGLHEEYDGRYRWGKEISIGVYEQNHIYSEPQKDVKNEFWDRFPTLTEGQVRSALAGLLFTGDDIYKKVSDISGGESARLQLAILSQTFNNVLMMDEPTNHLDMMSKEKLENALDKFQGTELIISHDRYLLNSLPDKIVYLSPNGVIVFNGKYDDFIKNVFTSPPTSKQPKEVKESGENYKSKTIRSKEAKRRNELSKLEKEIQELEDEIAIIQQFIESNSSDFDKLTVACNELEDKKNLLDELSTKWLELSEEEQ